MSENESRPLERWSSGTRMPMRTADAIAFSVSLLDLYAKAAAFERVLSAWGMTWEQYQQRGEISQDG